MSVPPSVEDRLRLTDSELTLLWIHATHLVHGTSSRYNVEALINEKSPLCREVDRALRGDVNVSDLAKRIADDVRRRVRESPNL